MDDRHDPSDLDWLTEFDRMADEQLGSGSSCHQVHPIVEHWLDNLLEGEPPESRSSVWQAMSCLATEVLAKLTPDDILKVVDDELDEDEFAAWLENIILLGRAFQMALDRGELDDL